VRGRKDIIVIIIMLLSHGIYIYKDNNWRPVGIVFGLGWQLSEAHIAFVLPVSIEDRPLLWMVVRSIILSTYLLMGAEKLISLLS
jgi:hypothetical protein